MRLLVTFLALFMIILGTQGAFARDESIRRGVLEGVRLAIEKPGSVFATYDEAARILIEQTVFLPETYKQGEVLDLSSVKIDGHDAVSRIGLKMIRTYLTTGNHELKLAIVNQLNKLDAKVMVYLGAGTIGAVAEILKEDLSKSPELHKATFEYVDRWQKLQNWTRMGNFLSRHRLPGFSGCGPALGGATI